jgi:DNA polymerase-3 subunit epsilon
MKPNDRADTVVVLDFETTGLSPDRGDRAIEIGAVRLEGGSIRDRFQCLMNPGRRISPFIEQYTGISNTMLKTAPPCEEVMAACRDFIGDHDLVAHNASFDQRFLDAELQRINRPRRGAFACSMLAAHLWLGMLGDLTERYRLEPVSFAMMRDLTRLPRGSVITFLQAHARTAL